MQPIECIDAELLSVACLHAVAPAGLMAWPAPIIAGCSHFEIVSVREISQFLAQTAHESWNFSHLTENLNYSAQGLATTWPSRFADSNGQPNGLAISIGRNPELIANNVYADRMGNGDVASGDGWTYRGAGLIGLTGKYEQQLFATAIGLDLAAMPAYLQSDNGAAMSAAWYFKTHGMIPIADEIGTTAEETKIINGGEEGLGDRLARFKALLAEFARRGVS